MNDLGLVDRLAAFAAECARISGGLPAGRVGSAHIAKALRRSSSGAGARREEAGRAASPRDRVRKLQASLMDLNEARMWLRIIDDSHYVPTEKVCVAIAEAETLTGILSADVAAGRKALGHAEAFSADEE